MVPPPTPPSPEPIPLPNFSVSLHPFVCSASLAPNSLRCRKERRREEGGKESNHRAAFRQTITCNLGRGDGVIAQVCVKYTPKLVTHTHTHTELWGDRGVHNEQGKHRDIRVHLHRRPLRSAERCSANICVRLALEIIATDTPARTRTRDCSKCETQSEEGERQQWYSDLDMFYCE